MKLYFESFFNKIGNDTFQQFNSPLIEPKPAKQLATDFYNLLSKAIDKVNSAQVKTNALTQKFIMGQLPNLHDLLIAAREAEFLFSLTVTITNKFIRAYEELMALH